MLLQGPDPFHLYSFTATSTAHPACASEPKRRTPSPANHSSDGRIVEICIATRAPKPCHMLACLRTLTIYKNNLFETYSAHGFPKTQHISKLVQQPAQKKEIIPKQRQASIPLASYLVVGAPCFQMEDYARLRHFLTRKPTKGRIPLPKVKRPSTILVSNPVRGRVAEHSLGDTPVYK